MHAAAIRCYESQTYPNRELVLVDGRQFATIGETRNCGNDTATGDIIAHFDDDDWSHPNRIAEQVALLQSSGADAVGYNEALFWREGRLIYDRVADESYTDSGSALLYSNRDPRYCLGTSLCYWRKTWERKPFRATSSGEDFHFCEGLHTLSSTSMPQYHPYLHGSIPDIEPRLIARIHAGNTSKNYADCDSEQSPGWRRAPEWNSYCAERMKL